MRDRLGRLARVNERRAPVDVSEGILRIGTESVPEMLDRLGELTLLSELRGPIALGVGVVGLEL